MIASVCTQIVSRYVFSDPLAWTEELARYAMIWSGLMAATVAYSRREDPVLVKMVKLPKPILRIAAQYIEVIAVTVFCGTILWASPFFLELHSERLTDSLELPSIYVVSIIPISVSIILYHTLVRLLNLLFGGGVSLPTPPN